MGYHSMSAGSRRYVHLVFLPISYWIVGRTKGLPYYLRDLVGGEPSAK